MSTIFDRIIAGELPCKKAFENERVLAIYDIAPVAPFHFLIMPKKAIPNLQAVTPDDMPLVVECLMVVQQLAKHHGIAEGYRLLTNNGKEAGQSVFHLHFHLIGGRPLEVLG